MQTSSMQDVCSVPPRGKVCIGKLHSSLGYSAMVDFNVSELTIHSEVCVIMKQYTKNKVIY